MKYQSVPLVGGFYSDETREWSSQDCLNWIPAQAEQPGTRTPMMLKTPPGLREYPLSTSGEVTIPSAPVRGTFNCEGILFIVVGDKLFRVDTSGKYTYVGGIPGTGRVVMSCNQQGTKGQQLIVVNGSSGYVYNTATQDFSRITDPGYPGAINAVFIDGYIIQIDPTRQFAFNSAAADATSYNTLDRFTSEVSPDLLVSMAVSNNELLLFSATSSEFFEDTSNPQQPFRSKRITMQRGCAGPYAVANMDNTVYWMGDDGNFYLLNGYIPQRISTRPIEEAVRGLDWSSAFTTVWESGGHKVCYWTFRNGKTWGYDASSQLWHRRASYGLDRWRIMSMTAWNGLWIAGDFQNNTIWSVDWNHVLEGDVSFISERTTGILSSNQNRILVSRLELIMRMGHQSNGDPDDHYVRIQYSDDGGYNWSAWDQTSIGAIGEYANRAVFTRQGSCRQRVYRIQCTSPQKRDLMGGAVVLQGTVG